MIIFKERQPLQLMLEKENHLVQLVQNNDNDKWDLYSAHLPHKVEAQSALQ